MKIYAVRFRVEKKNGDCFSFIPGNLFRSKENALKHAKEFVSRCAEEDETIDYELKPFVLVDD